MENTEWKTVRVTICSQYSEIILQESWIGYLFVFIHGLLLITTVSGNALILFALSNISVIYPPSKVLFRNLASTDLCIGLITEPFYIIYILSVVTENGSNTCQIVLCLLLISSSILCGISLCTLTMISVDRLLALFLGLRYKHVITLQRVRALLCFLWFAFSSVSLLYLWNPSVFTTVIALNVPCFLLVSTFSYSKIFLTLRNRQVQIRQESASEQFNAFSRARQLKYSKTVSNAMWVSVCVVACYLPYAIFTAVRSTIHDGYFSVIIESITVALIFLNSSINPLVYCWRIREVRRAVKGITRQCLGKCSRS